MTPSLERKLKDLGLKDAGLAKWKESVYPQPVFQNYEEIIPQGGIPFGDDCVRRFVAAAIASGRCTEIDSVENAINHTIALCNALGGGGGGE